MNTRAITDYWAFRICSPIVSGTIIYLLILLVNNSIEQALGFFISDEYFVCVLLAVIVSEATRFLLKNLSSVAQGLSQASKVALTIMTTIGLTSLLVCIGLSGYFRFALGYQPHISEIQPFIILYSGLSVALAAVYLSHYYISIASAEILMVENQLKEQADANFLKLTRGVNPDLLFETLESLLTHIQDDKIDEADDMIDDFALLYRYTLTKNSQEIVDIHQELKALNSLSRLINRLPYRKTSIDHKLSIEGDIIPGSLLYIIEKIIKKTIVSNHKVLKINLSREEHSLSISYVPHDKLNHKINNDDLKDLNRTYSLYTDRAVTIKENEQTRTIFLPLLQLQPEPS